MQLRFLEKKTEILGVKIIKFIFLFILFFFISSCNTDKKSKNSVILGKVIKIIDGDTYDILINKKKQRVRMSGIDAPERGMPFYNVSKKHLSLLCFGKTVIIEPINNDRHERLVANSYFLGKNLSLEMVRAGMSWHFKKYSDDIKLSEAEDFARKNKLGLWIDPNPKQPWEVRSLHRKGISTKDSFSISTNK